MNNISREPKNMIKYLIISLLFLASISQVSGQSKAENGGDVVQLSGVVAGKSLKFIPFATVKIKNTFRGAIAGLDGFYTFAAREQDTIEYSAVGFRKQYWIIPKVANTDKKIDHTPMLERDTIDLPPVVVSPWPSREHFRQAFLNLKLNDDLMTRARRNLDPAVLAELYEQLEADGHEQQSRTLMNFSNSFYYAGGQTNYNFAGGPTLPYSLTSPVALYKFINAIKRGDYKKKKNNRSNVRSISGDY